MMNLVKLILDCSMILLVMSIFEKNILCQKGKAKMIIAGIILCIGNFPAVFQVSDDFVIETTNLIAVILAAFIYSKLPLKKFLILYSVSLLSVGILEEGVYLIVPDGSFIFKKIAVICIICIVKLVVERIKKLSLSIHALPKRLILALCVLAFSLIVLFSGISSVFDLQEIEAAKYLSLAAMIAEVAVCVTMIVGVQLGVSKTNLQRENEVLQEYNEQQKRYYELLLKNEEDTRQFRHDLLNHLQCISGLLKDNQVNEAQAYIAQMTKEAGKKGRVYCTGNQIADIVLTSILSKVEKSVEVKVSGNLRDNLNISDYDLCIVISNLVNNAVEAVHKQNALHSYIHITFTAGRRVVKIEVRNSLASEQIASASSLQTQKSDKKLHGLGLKNVRMIVDKYDGKMEYSANEDTFEIYAILKENSSKK